LHPTPALPKNGEGKASLIPRQEYEITRKYPGSLKQCAQEKENQTGAVRKKNRNGGEGPGQRGPLVDHKAWEILGAVGKKGTEKPRP